jgi:hypothetical protein
MADQDFDKLKAGIFKQLEGESMDGLTSDDLAAAMSHPKAAEVVAELMPFEASSVQQGEPARDFELPFMPGHGGQEGETLRLSDRFADRPVALIFGSYT